MIDWERVQELQDEIGPEHMQEVIELFVTEVEEQLAGLNHTLDIVDLGKAIHFLKGCSLNIGFRVVAKLCRQLEEEAAEGTLDLENIQNLEAAFQKSRFSFEADFHKNMVHHHSVDLGVRKAGT
jgi:HPt (histidine-containing phosphotransfer) domain-containing protein